jgi:hypothetical protein
MISQKSGKSSAKRSKNLAGANKRSKNLAGANKRKK